MRYGTDDIAMPAGVVRRAADGSEVEFHSRWLGDDDLEMLYALHDTVVRGVRHPHMFRSDTPAFMARQLGRRGRTVGIFAAGTLIAYAAISFPDGDADNLGRDLPLTEGQLHQVADYDGSAVDPAFRGNGLQRLMSLVRNAYALAHGRHHIMGTVSPLNPVSLHNFLSLGLRVRGLKPKYAGALRYIIHRDLTCDLPTLVAAGRIEVPMGDIAAQNALLATGLVGVDVAFAGPEPRLGFMRESDVLAAQAA